MTVVVVVVVFVDWLQFSHPFLMTEISLFYRVITLQMHFLLTRWGAQLKAEDWTFIPRRATSCIDARLLTYTRSYLCSAVNGHRVAGVRGEVGYGFIGYLEGLGYV